ILQVRRLAARGFRDRLDRRRPAPSGLQRPPSEGDTVDGDQLDPAEREVARLVRLSQAFFLHLGHESTPMLGPFRIGRRYSFSLMIEKKLPSGSPTTAKRPTEMSVGGTHTVPPL